ncbi:M20/M25/M40 family metallo-hydrolase [Nonomuraea cavernae]|uniref:M20/M25/M40 family metallo-hydrolase n=1 Tax=Nonomuraea cavernae TaxID=2045107 RepID=A0A918DR55_9ACTN|nr:M20/M25/M40 family metallo-hydrolase [Nonomuraea cavernae]MCA2190424.1 M20/M25/M40 family metallo-hydrolase [Nonomuraea cavernae]GGO79681.1 hypothetical protein GCM10012289_64530 [Nonomuraea cavernae]
MVDSGAYGELRATVGHLAVHPDLTNIVPARAELTVDLRNPDDGLMARAEEDLAAFLRTLEEGQPGLSVATRRMARTSHVPFDDDVRAVIAQAADDHGLAHLSLLSGAGHDAQEIAALCPTAMIFVRGEYDGISHTPPANTPPPRPARTASTSWPPPCSGWRAMAEPRTGVTGGGPRFRTRPRPARKDPDDLRASGRTGGAARPAGRHRLRQPRPGARRGG